MWVGGWAGPLISHALHTAVKKGPLRKIQKLTTVVSNKFFFIPSFAVHPESYLFQFQKNSKMAITLYGDFASGPCRMVAMTLEYVGRKYDYKVVSLATGEQKSPEYLKVSDRVDKSTKLVSILGLTVIPVVFML